MLPALEQRHEVLAPTLVGHAGGPSAGADFDDSALADGVEAAMDAAGFATAAIVGNSLGGYVALQLAERGRAVSVVALAPAGGWLAGDPVQRDTAAHFSQLLDLVPAAAPYADQIVASPDGRRRASEFITESWEHIPGELLAHQIRGVAACSSARAFLDHERTHGFLTPERLPDCPVRFVWGAEDRILPWPGAAARYRTEAWADADWVVLDGVGHCPQLDVPAVTAELILEFVAR